MKRNSIQRWLGAGLLVSALAAGCNHTEPRPAARAGIRPPSAVSTMRPATIPGYTSSMPAAPVAQAAPTVSTPNLTPSPAAPARAEAPPPEKLPETTTTTGYTPESAGDAEAATKMAAGDTASANSAIAEPFPKRRSFVDITAQPSFSHAPDYSSLCGQLENSRLSKGWRLRYASVDESDSYGGSVSLLEDVRLTDMRDGQYVRVTGHLLQPDTRAIAPAYQIDSIQPLDKHE